MVSRLDEQFDQSGFKVREALSRPEIAARGGVAPLLSTREWTGIVGFKNCTVLFVTLDKSGKPERHRYADRFDGEVFYWDSQASNEPSTPKVQRLIDRNGDVLLFARVQEKVGGLTQPFIYCGMLEWMDHFGAKPVRFYWRMLDFPKGIGGSPELDALARWRPDDSSSGPSGTNGKGDKNATPSGPPGPEGKKTMVAANRYERDPVARLLCIEHYGANCWVCGFSFGAEYGTVGTGFVFVHHRVPLALRSRGGTYSPDPLKDLVPICGNCHAMVHRRSTTPKTAGPTAEPGRLSLEARSRLEQLREDASADNWEAMPPESE